MNATRFLLTVCALGAATGAGAQDTLSLGALQAAAVQRDPRAVQPELLRAASAQRLTTLDMERRPQLAFNGSASHQSDVTQIALKLPGASVPTPPKDRWQATLDLQQVVYDGGSIAARQSVERARLAESSAAVDAALYRLRGEVNGAFFSAYLLQERTREFDALLGDLEARLQLARARVVNGAALPRDTSAIVAEQLRAVLARDEAVSARRASIAVLERLTGRTIAEPSVFALPALALEVARSRDEGRVEALRARPEFAQFARTRERLEREAALTHVENRPRVLAFGQAGLGRPGLNQFRTDPDEFWQAGLRIEWRPWTWRSADRASESLRLQQRIVTTEERALADQLARAVESDLADMQRLQQALVSDARLVALRVDIERQARAQFTEGAITGAEYVETRTDVVEANLTLQRHRAELAQAEARYLTTLGLAPRSLQP
ncbi:MAG: TolC family protein [Gemmatimonadetes bacterium]|nr:TolC family protein [Gemmatimonadota bacterium]MBP9106113.1 TolC family protein [Gemmatimonadaceae bacterium]